jgi:uncharacterized membrane protein YdjX (TVP38/TMEM64 family)
MVLMYPLRSLLKRRFWLLLGLAAVVAIALYAILGATLAFLMGRHLAHQWVWRKVEHNVRLSPTRAGGSCC